MLFILYAIFILIVLFIVLAYLYSVGEMPDTPDWDELGLHKQPLERNA